MTTRENLIAALEGKTPEVTPYSIYDFFFTSPKYSIDEWRPLFDMGLGLCLHCSTVALKEHGVKQTVEYKLEGERRYAITRKAAPVGPLELVTFNAISSPLLIE